LVHSRQNGRSSSSGLVWRRVDSRPHNEQYTLGLQPRQLAIEAVHAALLVQEKRLAEQTTAMR